MFKRPYIKRNSLVSARFIFGGRLSFFIFVIGKVGTKKTHQVLLSAPIILQSYITDVTFHKTKLLLNTKGVFT